MRARHALAAFVALLPPLNWCTMVLPPCDEGYFLRLHSRFDESDICMQRDKGQDGAGEYRCPSGCAKQPFEDGSPYCASQADGRDPCRVETSHLRTSSYAQREKRKQTCEKQLRAKGQAQIQQRLYEEAFNESRADVPTDNRQRCPP